jgi:Na+-translocating ferredoxin:NAD+ oxidoreductase subunit B
MLSVLVLSAIALALGFLLGAAAARLKEKPEALESKIHALLPHTQCAQCGFAGCRPYAQAVAQGKAAIDLCPPGGAALIAKLTDLTGVTPNAARSSNNSAATPARVAFIDEAQCIGCALCLPACPVDAIVGAARQMHTVVAALCTGCELCVAPCPVDCIAMLTPKPTHPAWLRIAAGSA